LPSASGTQYRSGERSTNWVKSRAEVCDWRVHSEWARARFNPGRILRGPRSRGCCECVRRVFAGIPPSPSLARSYGFLDARSATYWTAVEGAGAKALRRRKWLCRWLDPFLVARSEFLEWTSENRSRHARFAGLRSDKGACDECEKGGAGAGRENSARPDTGFFYWRYQVPAGLAQSEMLSASRSRTDPSVWAPSVWRVRRPLGLRAG
jgi:hypothetical protein